ncbi:MAG: hypothetical protein M1475_00835 [Actinobacteria bacterium]|nr:hypothetical protein [Cyanobacteriota bacterium]MCL6086938.1 hypothetical protein [Actinomycetota bacterium]
MDKIIKTLRFPKKLLDEINSISIKKRMNFTNFVTSAVETYLRELRFTEAINESSGVWNLDDHPELKNGTEQYIRKIRKGRNLTLNSKD